MDRRVLQPQISVEWCTVQILYRAVVGELERSKEKIKDNVCCGNRKDESAHRAHPTQCSLKIVARAGPELQFKTAKLELQNTCADSAQGKRWVCEKASWNNNGHDTVQGHH